MQTENGNDLICAVCGTLLEDDDAVRAHQAYGPVKHKYPDGTMFDYPSSRATIKVERPVIATKGKDDSPGHFPAYDYYLGLGQWRVVLESELDEDVRRGHCTLRAAGDPAPTQRKSARANLKDRLRRRPGQ